MKRIKHGSNVCRCGYSENEHGPINRQLRQHGPIDRTFRATWAHQQNTQEQSGPATWAHQQNTQSNMDQQHGPINRTLGVNMGPSTEHSEWTWAHQQNSEQYGPMNRTLTATWASNIRQTILHLLGRSSYHVEPSSVTDSYPVAIHTSTEHLE